MRGKILSSKGNVYVVLGEDGIFYNVFSRCLLKFRNKNVMVGDECNIDDENFSIEDILPRKNSLIRPKVSNVDQIFVMMSVKRPELSKELIFKFLTSLGFIKSIVSYFKDGTLAFKVLPVYNAFSPSI